MPEAPLRIIIVPELDEAQVDRIRKAGGDRVVAERLARRPRRALAGAAFDNPDEAAAARKELDIALAAADILYTHNRLPTDLYERAPRLRWMHVAGAGVDRLLEQGLIGDKVAVTNSSGAHAIPIGEWVLGAMLAFAKGLPALRSAQQRHEWTRLTTGELYGSTCGIVGMGAIGAETARMAAALGMRVLAIRRSTTAETTMTFVHGELVDAARGSTSSPRAAALRQALRLRSGEPQGERNRGDLTLLPPAELPQLLRESDYVVLAVPLVPETRRLIGARELALMKATAVLINIARGEIVDEAALIEALGSGHPAGAALDVFEREPLPADSPLWDMENVIISPHVSASSGRYYERVTDIFVDNLDRFLAGRPLRNLIDPTRGY